MRPLNAAKSGLCKPHNNQGKSQYPLKLPKSNARDSLNKLAVILRPSAQASKRVKESKLKFGRKTASTGMERHDRYIQDYKDGKLDAYLGKYARLAIDRAIRDHEKSPSEGFPYYLSLIHI